MKTTSQTETPLDRELEQLLFSVAATWSDPGVWPSIWNKLFLNADKYGLDERIVRRRMKVLWGELRPAIMEKLRQETNEQCEKKRVEKQKSIEIEAHQNRQLVLLQHWMGTLTNGVWNYEQWDDFLDTLNPPVDVNFLEKKRDFNYIDPQTGLMWARNGNIAGEQMNFYDAISWANKLDFGGYSDWRLPSKDELEFFVRRGGARPQKFFNANGFNAVQACIYWSSTICEDDVTWVVNMSDGCTLLNYGNSYQYCAWPVRGRQQLEKSSQLMTK